MKEPAKTSATGRAVIRWLFAAAFIFAVAASGLFTGLMNTAGLFYLIFGSVAALAGLPRRPGRVHRLGPFRRHGSGGPGLDSRLRRDRAHQPAHGTYPRFVRFRPQKRRRDRLSRSVHHLRLVSHPPRPHCGRRSPRRPRGDGGPQRKARAAQPPLLGSPAPPDLHLPHPDVHHGYHPDEAGWSPLMSLQVFGGINRSGCACRNSRSGSRVSGRGRWPSPRSAFSSTSEAWAGPP